MLPVLAHQLLLREAVFTKEDIERSHVVVFRPERPLLVVLVDPEGFSFRGCFLELD